MVDPDYRSVDNMSDDYSQIFTLFAVAHGAYLAQEWPPRGEYSTKEILNDPSRM